MACPITVCKFVGTISLGLLTGLSYTVSTITIPALQSLPSASSAARTLKEIQLRSRKHVVALTDLTAISLLAAFHLSSPRRKHPYLLWTGLVALIGGLGLEFWFNGVTSVMCTTSVGCGFSSGSRYGFGIGSFMTTQIGGRREGRTDEEESNGAGSEIEIVEGDEAESSSNAAGGTATPTSEKEQVNGESVEKDMARERRLHKLRSWVLGLAFSMGVVGIWGDRA